MINLIVWAEGRGEQFILASIREKKCFDIIGVRKKQKHNLRNFICELSISDRYVTDISNMNICEIVPESSSKLFFFQVKVS